MVNLVIVSHSRKLAEGVAELARQMSAPEVKIAVAAGIGEARAEIGTDAIEILEAIQETYTTDGVLVLMDLGSALLSAEMAIELLEPEWLSNIAICPAPLVEGAVAASVQASLGSDLKTVCIEAMGSLKPKIEQLGPQEGVVIPSNTEPALEGQESVTLTLINPHGLHARPAAQFVKLAASFNADIHVLNLAKGKGPVSAKSLNSLATLGAVGGNQIQISAVGPESKKALEGLSELVTAGFYEMDENAVTEPEPFPTVGQTTALPPDERAYPGVRVSDGIALGPLACFQKQVPEITEYLIDDPEAEWERFTTALTAVKKAIREHRDELEKRIGKKEAAIFDAHLLILEDPEMIASVRLDIFDNRKNAALAWQDCIDQVVESYEALEDDYLKQRAVDVRSVGDQVLMELAGEKTTIRIESDGPVILFAEELTPFETSQLDLKKVVGIATVMGGPTSHSAILARSLGIPALTGVDKEINGVSNGTPVVLDGFNGLLWVEPPEEVWQESQQKREQWLAKRIELQKFSAAPAVMRDKRQIEVVANIGTVADARSAIANGAEGVGLLRTEFLYLSRETAPTEQEQFELLCEIGQAMKDRPIIVRTLDVGGDKELPYIHLPKEANPFLGIRAIRLSLREKDLFQTQLRAILRAGTDYQYRIMFPMIANLAELQLAKEQLELAHSALNAEGVNHRWPMETGIMVEIPSAAILSNALTPFVDFFSIGTNDLTQYTLAAERGNPDLAGYADGLHPAVLNLIRAVVDNAHKEGKWVGICGELAGNLEAIPILIGLGVDELSMNPTVIPEAKALIRKLDMEQITPLAENALAATSAETVRKAAGEFVRKL